MLALAPSGDAAPYPYFSETTFASIVKFGRRLLGSSVPFQRLCFRHSQPAHAAAYEAYFRVLVLFDQPQQLLAFDRRLLDQPLEGAIYAETIPFTETRTYVMRVSESVVIYRAKLKGVAGPVRLTSELKG